MTVLGAVMVVIMIVW